MFKRKTLSLLTAAVALAGFVGAANASTILSENFDSSTSAPAGWTLSGAATISTDATYAASGSNSLDINNLNAPSAATPALNLSGGTTATLSFEWTTDIHGGAYGRTPFIDYSSDGGASFTQIASFTVPSNTSSVPAETTFTKTINASGGYSFTNNSEFRIRGDSAGGTTQAPIYVDNLTVSSDASPVPEPASLALMGLGGLLLISRRRRTQVDG